MVQHLVTLTQTWPSGRISHNPHVRTFAERIRDWDVFQRIEEAGRSIALADVADYIGEPCIICGGIATGNTCCHA